MTLQWDTSRSVLPARADPSLPIPSSRTELNLHQMAESHAFGMGVWSKVSDGPPGWEVVEGPVTHCLLLLWLCGWRWQSCGRGRGLPL